MRILLDHGVPAPLRQFLRGHSIKTAYELGWSTLRNGELIARALEHFDALITTDRNLRYQQNLVGVRLAILVLPSANWPRLRTQTQKIASAIDTLTAGQYIELDL